MKRFTANFDTCRKCPLLRRKGEPQGHGKRQKTICGKNGRELGENVYVLPIPDWCELEDAGEGKAWEALDDLERLFFDAQLEAMKAMRKFPQPNYVISKFAEEAGEVVKAAIHCAEGRETKENLRGEIKQAMAMLVRMCIEGDEVHGLSPVLEDEADE